MQLVKAATSLIDKLYKEGIEFKKCGVMLCELIKEEHRTIGLLTDVEQLEKEQALMTAFQSIQSKFGKAKIGVLGIFPRKRTKASGAPAIPGLPGGITLPNR